MLWYVIVEYTCALCMSDHEQYMVAVCTPALVSCSSNRKRILLSTLTQRKNKLNYSKRYKHAAVTCIIHAVCVHGICIQAYRCLQHQIQMLMKKLKVWPVLPHHDHVGSSQVCSHSHTVTPSLTCSPAHFTYLLFLVIANFGLSARLNGHDVRGRRYGVHGVLSY